MSITIKHLAIVCISIFIFTIWSCAGKKEIVETPIDKESPKISGTFFWAVKPEVNIRNTYSVQSDKLGKLNDGDSVLVVENVNGWYSIVDENSINGWIRSDLLGPKEVSVFAKAITYTERLKENKNIDLFFDKKLLHRRVYIEFPAENYSSKSLIEAATKQLVKDYQEEVYRGDVTARVLKPGSDEEFITLSIKGQANPDIKLPILPFGILKNVDTTNPEKISLIIETPFTINNTDLLKSARNIVSIYPISYSSVEVIFSSKDNSCRLWLLEDESGEQYKFNHCPN